MKWLCRVNKLDVLVLRDGVEQMTPTHSMLVLRDGSYKASLRAGAACW